MSLLDLLALPQHRSHIQFKLVQLVGFYSVDYNRLRRALIGSELEYVTK